MPIAEPLVISNWKDGVADSPHEGFGMMKNADIEAFPGAIKSQKKLLSIFLPITTRTFTADASDLCTASGNLSSQNYVGSVVRFTTTNTLPAGLSINTNYFLIYVSASTFKVATTLANANAGTAIDITDAGTGVHTITQLAIGTINHIVKDQRTTIWYLQDSNARVWFYDGSRAYLLNGNTLTNGSGNGLCLLRASDGASTWLFVFRNALIDVINVYGASDIETPSWTSAWQTMNTAGGSGNRHHAIVGQDNIIYYTDDRYLGSIKELTVFVPGTSATYSFNQDALDFPQGEVAVHLEELGVNLLTAGNTYNKIYPWDRISDSFALPLDVPENSVKRLKNIGNTVYILAGTKGNIYKTQGLDVKLFRKIPDYLTNNSGTILSNPVTWGGIGAKSGGLLVGLDGYDGGSGVYLIYPDGRILQDNTPTGGNLTFPFNKATAIYSEDEFYFVGYAGGADRVDASRYSSYETVIQTGLYRVGNKTEKASYTDLELQMAKISANGAGHARISWRPDISGAFTVMDGATFTADGVALSFNSDVGLIDIENIQLQIEMDGTFELLNVILTP